MELGAIFKKAITFLGKLYGYLLAAMIGGYIAYEFSLNSLDNALEVLVLTSYQESLQNNLTALTNNSKDLECELFNQANKNYEYLTSHTIKGKFIIGAPDLAKETEECISKLIQEFEVLKQKQSFLRCVQNT